MYLIKNTNVKRNYLEDSCEVTSRTEFWRHHELLQAIAEWYLLRKVIKSFTRESLRRRAIQFIVGHKDFFANNDGILPIAG